MRTIHKEWLCVSVLTLFFLSEYTHNHEMFVFDAFTAEPTKLEFPISGGVQVTTCGGSM